MTVLSTQRAMSDLCRQVGQGPARAPQGPCPELVNVERVGVPYRSSSGKCLDDVDRPYQTEERSGQIESPRGNVFPASAAGKLPGTDCPSRHGAPPQGKIPSWDRIHGWMAD